MNTSLSLPQIHRKVAGWLAFNCFLLIMMIIIGGATRLTDSGLSIVHWDLLSGILPPLNDQAWTAVFQAYKQSPEFQQINNTMTLYDFKRIFWLEYVHRLCGRIIGIVYLIPVIIAFRHQNLRHSYFPKLLGIWLLGGLQGVVGWYMVKSGLYKDPHVSHYRLSLHLLLGFTTYALTLYYTLKLYNDRPLLRFTHSVRRLYYLLTLVFTLTILYGAWVAGLKAGLIYNTFPMMDGQWIPSEIWTLRPWWRNLCENHATVQWLHRLLAMTTVGLGLIFWLKTRRQWTSQWIAIAVMLQASLGIATLIMHVPVILGVMHQAGALLVITSLISFLFLPMARR